MAGFMSDDPNAANQVRPDETKYYSYGHQIKEKKASQSPTFVNSFA